MTPKTAPDSPDFTERIATLQKAAYPEPTAVGGRPGVQRSLEALQAAHTTAIEALRVAIEGLHQQHDELVSTRQAVETERQRYQELFDLVPDDYLVTGADGTIREANRVAALLLNVSPQALIGKSFSLHSHALRLSLPCGGLVGGRLPPSSLDRLRQMHGVEERLW